MKKLLLISTFSLFISMANAQTIVKLWSDNPPTNNGLSGAEVVEDGRISNVSVPEMWIYKPEPSVNKGIAVVICPGGGYGRLAVQHEGNQFVKWLNTQGITGVVLKYRLPNGHKEVPLDDLQQAMRYVRSKATEWNVSADKVGVVGFSAGGHLAASASTNFLDQETRPDFSILFYPVVTMGEFTHGGSKRNLLGQNPSAEDIAAYSIEKRVTASTPRALIMLSDDDKSVPPLNSVKYYEALKKYNIPATMYIFPVGGHGWGMNDSFKYHNEMLSLLKSWLEELYP